MPAFHYWPSEPAFSRPLCQTFRFAVLRFCEFFAMYFLFILRFIHFNFQEVFLLRVVTPDVRTIPLRSDDRNNQLLPDAVSAPFRTVPT